MKKLSLWPGIGLFILLFSYFAAWALIKPPFQAPDEFNHAIKAYSVSKAPFITPEPLVKVDVSLLNPLLFSQQLKDIPLSRAVSLSDAQINAIKKIDWGNEPGEKREFTSAFNYPYLYYVAVFSVGQSISSLAGASPYDSVFIYRLVSSVFAALAWILVYLSFPPELPYRRSIVLFMILNPMLAFMSSSINPDVLFYPAVALVIIGFYRIAFHRHEKGLFGFAALGAAGLIKSTSLVLFPAVALTSGVSFLCKPELRFRRSLLVGLAALVLAWGGFYLWAPRPDAIAYSGIPVHFTLWEYFLGNKYGFLVKSYWGILGWLDYALPSPWYLALYLLLILNAVLTLAEWRKWREVGFTWYALLFSAFFVAGVFAVEYLMLPRYGFVLQGRYFLPASIGLAMFLVHRQGWARNALLVYLALFSLAFFRESVDRYYDGDWARTWRALPFTEPADDLPGQSIRYLAAFFPEFPVANGIAGFVDVIERDGTKIHLRGWSSVRDDSPAIEYRIFTPEIPEQTTGYRQFRPDVAKALGDPLLRKSGFEITLVFPEEERALKSLENICVTASDGSEEVFLLSSDNQECRRLLP